VVVKKKSKMVTASSPTASDIENPIGPSSHAPVGQGSTKKQEKKTNLLELGRHFHSFRFQQAQGKTPPLSSLSNCMKMILNAIASQNLSAKIPHGRYSLLPS